MRRPWNLTALALLLLAPAGIRAEGMKDEMTLEGADVRKIRTLFGTYGPYTRRTVFLERGGVRFRLPALAAGVPQTGVYSYFTLSGDCEVTLGYALVSVADPKKGYGCGVGLAFDAGKDTGWGAIQRVIRPSEESGYFLQTLLGPGDSRQEEARFVTTVAKQGKMALRRSGTELVFLVADEPKAPLLEIGRLPFTGRTIRAVRLFADTGGSPTALDAWVGQIHVRAGEITGGVPKSEVRESRWWLWGLLGVLGLAAAFWGWRVYRRRAEE